MEFVWWGDNEPIIFAGGNASFSRQHLYPLEFDAYGLQQENVRSLGAPKSLQIVSGKHEFFEQIHWKFDKLLRYFSLDQRVGQTLKRSQLLSEKDYKFKVQVWLSF